MSDPVAHARKFRNVSIRLCHSRSLSSAVGRSCCGADACLWPTNGETLFRQRCGACHQVATPRNGVGPHLQGVVGRAAGSVEGYNYSPAIKGSGIVWSADNLDGFLTNPGAMVRGTRMTQRFANAAERQAIIEFLQQKQD